MSKCKGIYLIVVILNTFSFSQEYGIESRVANNSLLISWSGNPVEIDVMHVFPGLSFSLPTFLTNAGDGTNRLFVIENRGVVYVFDNDNSVDKAEVFLDIQNRVNDGGEKGLLGLAFHPDFETNKKFYVSYTAGNLFSRISEFVVGDDPDQAIADSERVIIKVDQPAGNHNGGMIAFGQDGYLYIALGDGGGGGDTYKNGQNKETLLGTILRIDIDNKQDGLEYKIPSDNPFVGNTEGTKEEIWAYGLRNPWRFSFDRLTGDLWCGDVGQGTYEEVDLIKKGGNYGWNIMEGFHCYGSSSCDTSGLELPIAEYHHSEGYSITGGYVYRGTEIERLQGTYFYGDYGTRKIWGLNYNNGQILKNEIMGESPSGISSFGEDEQGEIYILGYGNGRIYKIVEKEGEPPSSNIPDTLSKSGLYSDILSGTVSPGIIKYDLISPLWSDGAYKERFFALPGTSQITFSEEGIWEFPNESVIVKNFLLEMEIGNPESRQIVETRFLVKRTDGSGWDGFSYMWNEDQSDAFLLDSSAYKSFTISNGDSGYTHRYYYPSGNECLKCHTPQTGFVLGPKTAQLNRTFLYENSVSDNQLRTLNHIDFFTTDIGEDYSGFTTMVSPDSLSAAIGLRARAYLDANCSGCHLPGGTGGGEIDFRYKTALNEMNIIDKSPAQGDLGISDAKLIYPGEPEKSLVYLRMIRRDEMQMPPLAVHVIDTFGTNLVKEWINSLETSSASDANMNTGKIPGNFVLMQNTPNPFNPMTEITFQVPQNNIHSVELVVYNILGKKVKILLNDKRMAGLHKVTWDGKDENAHQLPSGIYFYQLRAGKFTDQKRMLLIK